jgi:hypothetical protein
MPPLTSLLCFCFCQVLFLVFAQLMPLIPVVCQNVPPGTGTTTRTIRVRCLNSTLNVIVKNSVCTAMPIANNPVANCIRSAHLKGTSSSHGAIWPMDDLHAHANIASVPLAVLGA